MLGVRLKTNHEGENKMKDRVQKALRDFEYYTINITGVRGISGGFATAEIDGEDKSFYYIKLKWGIQSDCEDTVHTEKWLLDKNTLQIVEGRRYSDEVNY